MTPAARQAAAIGILDRWIAGQPVEAALTHWARASRFAGSGDREAVRDLVFRAVRQWRSLAALGGGGGRTGAAARYGARRWRCLRRAGPARGPPPPPDAEEVALLAAPAARASSRGEALDCPDWLLPLFDAALDEHSDAVLGLMRDRAPVFVRVNSARASRDAVAAELVAEGIAATPHPLAETALEVTSNARRLRNIAAFDEGRIEMQDAASQAMALDFAASRRAPGVLDYCAGRGKTLALAARGMLVTAHDIDPRRMCDLPLRGARRRWCGCSTRRPAAAGLRSLPMPCPSSGSLAPRARGEMAPYAGPTGRTDRYPGRDLLHRCAALTAPGGVLGYATCSLLQAENEARTAAFLAAHRLHEVEPPAAVGRSMAATVSICHVLRASKARFSTLNCSTQGGNVCALTGLNRLGRQPPPPLPAPTFIPLPYPNSTLIEVALRWCRWCARMHVQPRWGWHIS